MMQITVKANHVSSDEAYMQCRERENVSILDDNVAVTVASWFQSPGHGGRHLAALASGSTVDHGDVLSDIVDNRSPHDTARISRPLGMLAKWLSDRTLDGSAEYHGPHVDYPHYPGSLYDCRACELGPCQCDETTAPCVSARCAELAEQCLCQICLGGENCQDI